jgi:hypothetical protein
MEKDYLAAHRGKVIKARGNLSCTDAFFQFLGIENTSSWAPDFDNNPTIDAYLRNIYTNHQPQLTEMSIERYAKMIAHNIWIDYIVKNDVEVQTTIARTEGELGKFNPTNYNMSDELVTIQTRTMMPRGFNRTVNVYQQSMLNPNTGQPEGFLKFTTEWRAIIAKIVSYEGTEPYENMSRGDIRQNIRNMFDALNTLIATGSYFTRQDFLDTEGITHNENPDNGTPMGNSQTTGWTFDPGYIRPVLAPVVFGDLAALFNPVLPVPTGLIGTPLTVWLTDNDLIEPTNLATVQTALTSIAAFLNANPAQTITITGLSDYNVLGGVSATPAITTQIATERANFIRGILIAPPFSVNADQIAVGAQIGDPGINITQP